MSRSKVERIADELIKLTGGKREAKRLIDASPESGRLCLPRRLGRPRGLPYQKVDQLLLTATLSLSAEWEKRRHSPPSAEELLKRIVKACWEQTEDEKSLGRGRWNSECFALIGLDKESRLGSNPDAVIRRLRDRPKPRPIIAIESGLVGITYPLPEGPGGPGSLWAGEVRCPFPAEENWKQLQVARPDLRLLPDTDFG
jgi:hypothetical protein